jgi:hypothetical protein
LYGVADDEVFIGFVSPDSDAKTSSPHVSPDEITRIVLVEAEPLVDQVSCGAQFSPMKQMVTWLLGPCSVNIPTVNLYIAASPPGE